MLLLVPSHVYSYGGGETLHNFSITAKSEKYNLTAYGRIASIGSFMPIIASQNVIIEIENLKSKKISKHICSSFTFEISDSFTTCEIRESQKTLAIDFDNSEFNTYPLKEERDSTFKMEIKILPSKSRPGLYKRTIFFNTEMEPLAALLVCAHELRHGCSTDKRLESRKLFATAYLNYQKFARNSNEQLAALEDIYASYQIALAEQIRAYKFQVSFFNEIAASAPAICNKYTLSNLFGKQIASLGKIHLGLQRQYQGGTIHLFL